MKENQNFEKHACQCTVAMETQIAWAKICHTKLLPDKF